MGAKILGITLCGLGLASSFTGIMVNDPQLQAKYIIIGIIMLIFGALALRKS